MFKFIKNGKEIMDNRIHWKFAGTDLEFRSDEERLKPNIAFWRKKHNIGPDVEVEFLNVKKVEDNVKPIITEPSTSDVNVVDNSESIEKPVVSQDPENHVDTPKRKSRAKTSKL